MIGNLGQALFYRLYKVYSCLIPITTLGSVSITEEEWKDFRLKWSTQNHIGGKYWKSSFRNHFLN